MEILGIHVPSTAPVFLGFLAVHVIAAMVAVVAGAGAMLVRHKGRGRHSRFGLVYFAALCVVSATATALAVMRLGESWHLLILAVIALGLASTGWVARRRHWSGDGAHIVGMGGSYVVMLTAFYVDNGDQLPVWDLLPTLAYWLIPALVGVPLIWRAIRRARHGRDWSGAAGSGLGGEQLG